MDEQFDDVVCPACEAEQIPHVSYTGEQGGDWYRCRHCGMTFTTPPADASSD